MMATKDDNLPNILFLGLDSISRLNFDRHFPMTAKLLAKHGFYTLYGYNKVADNTFVNLTPLLTGHYLEDIWNETISKTVFLNYFPLIWKEYSNRGYNTLLLEDAPYMATFNYLKIGFNEKPTDYYLRPFSLAIEPDVHNDCYLDKPEIEIYYDYVYDFVKAINERHQRYFGFTFLARLTHDHINSAGLADSHVHRLLDKLFTDSLLANTVVVFFSDHGIRFGKIRETLSGKLEERMPFMHIYLPDELRNKYDKSMAINENRLTTPFDIHSTLKHLITGKQLLNSGSNGVKYGKTLLQEIPEDRSCQSIPILEHWCSCQSSEPVADLNSVSFVSRFIVDSINRLFATDFVDKCQPLTLRRTVSAYEQHLNDKVLQFEQSLNDVMDRHVVYSRKRTKEHIRHYLITISVEPSGGLFEATVNVDTRSRHMQIIGDISRINRYYNQSDCIDNQFVRRYCYCFQ
ncbi:uncharacterized protein LOC128962940 [Oppia nitens]|uniref:uncharacterized protein LOC128962940 n=1 Tax=Oppia nitens TaxID=1686743 RepID=UPI0023D9E434|nr:uncharacterized protein LOC128962940 [Oppia nitens]